MRVYEKVRAYIDDNGLKQISVAQRAGIPKSTFNAMMNGRRIMYADDLKSICLALNVSPELFIEFTRNPVKSNGK
ncbi:MAG: helix-turn-helix domain-containing protein [Oscillospiraceae bacterium]|nr:helix-turn-helix domain-containing protein [Oscillospiraceae bacterium]